MVLGVEPGDALFLGSAFCRHACAPSASPPKGMPILLLVHEDSLPVGYDVYAPVTEAPPLGTTFLIALRMAVSSRSAKWFHVLDR